MILNSTPWDVRGASVITVGVEVSAILQHVGLSLFVAIKLGLCAHAVVDIVSDAAG